MVGPLDAVDPARHVLVSWGFTTLFAWGETANWSHVDPQEKANIDPTANSLGGLYFGQLAIAVLGALIITAEYSTGGIRTTLTAVPQRLKVLAAKGVTFARRRPRRRTDHVVRRLLHRPGLLRDGRRGGAPG